MKFCLERRAMVTKDKRPSAGCYTLKALRPSRRELFLRAGFSSAHACTFVGEWLSLVEHLVRDQGVGGSNPLSPTIFFCFRRPLCYRFF
jgi:hypothetical protein